MNPFLEIALRTIGSFLILLVLTRLIGKQQLGELNASDFINAIVIGSIGASMATDHKENVSYYIVGIVIFGGLTFFTNYTALKYRPFRKLVEGQPLIVIHNGKVLEKNMSQERYSMDNLVMQLREKNVFDIADVEFAVLESNGELSVLLKSNKQPLTASDLNVPTQYKGFPSKLIIDGNVIQQGLKQNNLTEQWLMDELKKHGIGKIDEVNYASLDAAGNLYIDKRRDELNKL